MTKMKICAEKPVSSPVFLQSPPKPREADIKSSLAAFGCLSFC